MQRHDDQWIRFFSDEGYPRARGLGAGMEGAVYALDDDLVAKVWDKRDADELVRLQLFYAAVAEAGPAFRTPLIHRVSRAHGKCFTIEQRLRGTPLSELNPLKEDVWPKALACTLDVLDGLASVRDSPALRGVNVLDENRPFWDGRGGWPKALTALIGRRLDRFGDQLRACVPGLDNKVEKLCSLIGEIPDVTTALLHGDLIPANILVDDAFQVTAALDFGFLSTAGDPAFDAAVTASIFEMYGRRGRWVESAIDAAVAGRFGHPPERITLYRCAYALITSNAYDPRGQDGHFRWCVDIVRRDEVRDLLGS